MKGVLLHKDGRRVDMDPRYFGGIRFHQITRGPAGEYLETIFVADNDLESPDTLVYRETETTDISDKMAEARRRNEQNTWDLIRRGLDRDS